MDLLKLVLDETRQRGKIFTTCCCDPSLRSMSRRAPDHSGYLQGEHIMVSEHILQKHASDFWLARGAIAFIAGLQLLIVNDLTWGPRWLAPTVEVAMLVPLSIATAWTIERTRLASGDQHWRMITRHRRAIRTFALILTAVITAMNLEALVALVRALLHGGTGESGQSLLLDALNIWVTNVVVFALWFWNLDRGGPAMHSIADQRATDFLFPQMLPSFPADQNWAPGFIDYLYLSFTNATAFSPTDTMPLTPRGKALMMTEAIISLLTVGLVAARAVNILA